jgi:hypothetical protein
MTGARTTGKSCYVGVVMRALERYLLQMQVTLSPADARTGPTFKRLYEEPLLDNQRLLLATSRTIDSEPGPLIWKMGASNGRPRYLVIGDLAGEDLETTLGQADHLTLIVRADAVFFMFDPLRVPEVVAQLTNLIPTPQVGGDPKNVLDGVLGLIGGAGTRLAIILTKFDTLEAFRAVEATEWSLIMSNADSSLLRCPADSLEYDEDDGALVDAEVRSLLLKLGAEALVLLLEHPANGRPVRHRFFAVSALGQPPRAEAINQRGIAPHRCLDPMKWVLSEMGVIRK